LSDADLVDRALPYLVESVDRDTGDGKAARIPTADDLAVLLPLVRERLPRLDAIGELVDFVFLDRVEVDPAQLVPKRWDREATIEGLREAHRVIEATGQVSFEADELEAVLRELCEQRGWKPGDLFMAIRVAVTGRTATPPLFDTLVAVGYERTLERIDAAAASLEAPVGARNPDTA
jgi:glutamyl-tRNA synthetase